ncbi:hypothetical protein HOY80DRAFT_767134 [Tuber brumale]|nr:hypothetical protein HOY80DRAFT_767134 [Tuber brumale]
MNKKKESLTSTLSVSSQIFHRLIPTALPGRNLQRPRGRMHNRCSVKRSLKPPPPGPFEHSARTRAHYHRDCVVHRLRGDLRLVDNATPSLASRVTQAEGGGIELVGFILPSSIFPIITTPSKSAEEPPLKPILLGSKPGLRTSTLAHPGWSSAHYRSKTQIRSKKLTLPSSTHLFPPKHVRPRRLLEEQVDGHHGGKNSLACRACISPLERRPLGRQRALGANPVKELDRRSKRIQTWISKIA